MPSNGAVPTTRIRGSSGSVAGGASASRSGTHEVIEATGDPGRSNSAATNRWNVALTGWTRPSHARCGLSSTTVSAMPTVSAPHPARAR